MVIPKSFQLGGVKWKVKFKKKLLNEKKDELRGSCDWDKSTIYLSTTDEGKPIPEDLKGQTLYHEILHSILVTMDHPLKYDEPFIQTLATFLHQFETTKK